jgi:large subunit ribosomal protein L25
MIRKDLEKALENEAFFSQVIDVNVDGDVQPAILKDLQRHPAKDRVMHADFLRVDAKKGAQGQRPAALHQRREVPRRQDRGRHHRAPAHELEVQCLPGNIPEYIEVDMLDVTTADIIHISDLKLPEGVTSTALALGEDHDMAVASVICQARRADDARKRTRSARGSAPDEWKPATGWRRRRGRRRGLFAEGSIDPPFFPRQAPACPRPLLARG